MLDYVGDYVSWAEFWSCNDEDVCISSQTIYGIFKPYSKFRALTIIDFVYNYKMKNIITVIRKFLKQGHSILWCFVGDYFMFNFPVGELSDYVIPYQWECLKSCLINYATYKDIPIQRLRRDKILFKKLIKRKFLIGIFLCSFQPLEK